MTKANKNKKQYVFTSKGQFYSAFRYNNLVFYGGPVADLGVTLPWDLIMKLEFHSKLPMPEVTITSSTPTLFPQLSKTLNELLRVPVLQVYWPDGGVPDFPSVCWTSLVKDLLVLDKNAKKDVEIAVCCRGGHGRTGTALAILKNLLLKEKCDPVVSIRESYMEEAVETYRQIEYVEFITGRTVKVPGSYSYRGKGSSYTTGSNKPSSQVSTTSYIHNAQAIVNSEDTDEDEFDLTRITKSKEDAPLDFAEIARKIEAGEYEVTPVEFEKYSDLGSIAVKTTDIIAANKKDSYPIHKATDCVSKNCPDYGKKLMVHCGKQDSKKGWGTKLA